MQASNRDARREAHRQAKMYISSNLPVLIQLAIDKGGKEFKKNLKARGGDFEALLGTDFARMPSAELYKVAKSVIYEIYEAYPRNDPSFQIVRNLASEFDQRLWKQGAFRSPNL